MKWAEKVHPVFGRSLYVNHDVVELIIPLEYGIRIGHFSYINEENVFFVQPPEMCEFNTEDGWRIRGGHRLWLAPERQDTYDPDNDPISYEIQDQEVLLSQEADKETGAKKSIKIAFSEDSSVHLTHIVKNCGEEPITRSLWAVSVMAPGGTEYIPLGSQEGEMSHWHRLSWWDHTCLGDERVTYEKEQIRIQHLPMEKKYKIGVGHPEGPVRYVNNHIIFEKSYDVKSQDLYPDGNVSFETFFCFQMAEIESLSPLCTILPGEQAEHKETWKLYRV